MNESKALSPFKYYCCSTKDDKNYMIICIAAFAAASNHVNLPSVYDADQESSIAKTFSATMRNTYNFYRPIPVMYEKALLGY